MKRAFPISVKGVLVVDGGVVLVRNPRDEWELPGGRIENGESPESTLAREFALTGEFRPRLSDEHSEFGVFPVNDLPNAALPIGYRRSIERWRDAV